MDDNKAPVLRYVQEFANGDVDIAGQIFAPDFVYHLPTLDAQISFNRDQYADAVRALFRAYPDWRAELVEVIVEGGQVVDRVSVTATHSGGPAPTGEHFQDVEAVHIWRVEAGKLKELWIFGSRAFNRMTDLMRLTAP